ncbi:hypothetical protein DFH07DRAFT_773664 [Mycena maculata]|uniref:Uncharacterized protein n=1 Tax=Mycena maculata TaxID=230809 RepID=A0AAD7NCP0_9AGAR|nr:hypothetical protein DFH07DRAFT_773664 [Mycena maculata]
MSATPNPQAQADAFLHEIRSMKKSAIDSYQWPESWPESIEYDEVSTRTCNDILGLIAPTAAPGRWDTRATPKTPKHKRIARKIKHSIDKRNLAASRHIMEAQSLNDRIDRSLDPIVQFLRAARRTEGDQFNFPFPEEILLAEINSIRGALDAVEAMVVGNTESA